MTRNDPTTDGDDSFTNSKRSRREFLGGASALGAIALAGCSGSSETDTGTTTTDQMTEMTVAKISFVVGGYASSTATSNA